MAKKSQTAGEKKSRSLGYQQSYFQNRNDMLQSALEAVFKREDLKAEEYAAKVVQRLVDEGYRVDQLVADEQLGKRIRASKLERIPYVLVVGDDDVANSTVGVNPRGGDVRRDVPLTDFLQQLSADVGETRSVA